MLRQHQDSLLPRFAQGEEGHENAEPTHCFVHINSLFNAVDIHLAHTKLPRSSLVWCVLIVCLTLLIFTYLTRKSLCEIRYRDGYREVAAFMAYESGK